MTKLKNGWKNLVKFHKDEEGMESVQAVAIVAVAAVILIFLKGTLWPKVKTYATTQVETLASGDEGN